MLIRRTLNKDVFRIAGGKKFIYHGPDSVTSIPVLDLCDRKAGITTDDVWRM
jgi:hypothetical protein